MPASRQADHEQGTADQKQHDMDNHVQAHRMIRHGPIRHAAGRKKKQTGGRKAKHALYSFWIFDRLHHDEIFSRWGIAYTMAKMNTQTMSTKCQ